MARGVTVVPVRGSKAAERSRTLSDWSTQSLDPDGVWAADGQIIGARAEDLGRNNALAAALRSAWRAGVVGPHGRVFKSLYQYDSEPDTDDSERASRRQIMDILGLAWSGKNWDVQGLRSFRDMQATVLDSEMDRGDAIVLRTLRDRPWTPLRTCARVIHASRVDTPPGGSPRNLPPGHEITNGVELDLYGDPTALWIRRAHPGKPTAAGSQAFVRRPLRDARGMPTLSWSATRTQPEALRGTGWIGPVATLLRHMDGTLEAHVIAKRLQACIGMIMAVPDPERAAAADRNGEVLRPNTKMAPGKIYYVKIGSNVTPFDFKYNGADLKDFFGLMSQLIAAGFGPGLPAQYVERFLTRSNMASSRTALLQAWQSLQYQGTSLETDHLDIWKMWVLDEAISRGLLILPTADDMTRAGKGRWRGPPRLSPDPNRELSAGEKAVGLGASPETVLADQGMEFDDEVRTSAENRALADAQGVPLGPWSKQGDEPAEEPAAPVPAPTKDEED